MVKQALAMLPAFDMGGGCGGEDSVDGNSRWRWRAVDCFSDQDEAADDAGRRSGGLKGGGVCERRPRKRGREGIGKAGLGLPKGDRERVRIIGDGGQYVYGVQARPHPQGAWAWNRFWPARALRLAP